MRDEVGGEEGDGGAKELGAEGRGKGADEESVVEGEEFEFPGVVGGSKGNAEGDEDQADEGGVGPRGVVEGSKEGNG